MTKYELWYEYGNSPLATVECLPVDLPLKLTAIGYELDDRVADDGNFLALRDGTVLVAVRDILNTLYPHC